jgi:hypothetical protein
MTMERVKGNSSKQKSFPPVPESENTGQISLNYMTYAGPIIMGVGGTRMHFY